MNISEIQRHIGRERNVGRLQLVFFMYQKDVVQVPYVADVYGQNVAFTGTITIQDGSEVSHLYFTPGTDSFEERSSISEQGELYNTTLKLSVPKDREEVSTTLAAIRDNLMFVVYIDRNEVVKVVENLRLEKALVISEDNAYNLTFVGNSTRASNIWDVTDGNAGFSGSLGTVAPPSVPAGAGGSGSISLIEGTNTLRLTFGSQVFDLIILSHHNDTRHSLQIEQVI